MACSVMADEAEICENIHRPFHDASQAHKILCPEAQCVEKLLFFEESGLGRHFRAIHKKEATAKDLAKSALTMKHLYGQETLRYISSLSERKSKVRTLIFHRFRA